MDAKAHREDDLPFAALAVAVVFLCGLIFSHFIIAEAFPHTPRRGLTVYFYLFRDNEPVALAAALLGLGVVFLGARLRLGVQEVKEGRPSWHGWCFGSGLALLAATVTALGAVLIHHKYPLSMDEFSMHWQAQAFLSGHVRVPVAPDFLPYAEALTPTFVSFDPPAQTWISVYLPVYALLQVPFLALGAGVLLNPLLCGLSILLIAAVARRLWPAEPSAPGLAALLLATGGQFLFTGMSFYPMPAHLCLNLLWLLLFLRGDRWSLLLLPWVGVAALGLHQPTMHALFALPLLLALAFRQRWPTTLYTAAVYLLGGLFWLLWLRLARPAPVGALDTTKLVVGRLDSYFGWPDGNHVIWQGIGLVEFFSWQNLAVCVFAVLALRRFGRLPPVVRLLGCSLVLTYGFHFFVAFEQGHGWGFRYGHAVLGNFVLLAVGGALRAGQQRGRLMVRRVVLAAALFALGFQVPLRAWQVERFVRPFACATAYLERVPADVVLVDVDRVWYSGDLVRNGPHLTSRPVVARLRALSGAQVTELHRRFCVRIVGREELLRLGLFPTEPD